MYSSTKTFSMCLAPINEYYDTCCKHPTKFISGKVDSQNASFPSQLVLHRVAYFFSFWSFKEVYDIFANLVYWGGIIIPSML